tara:strand:+ start:2262 stop:2621 length:360 start_codon:yes stop_codon:yes gene_type:complete
MSGFRILMIDDGNSVPLPKTLELSVRRKFAEATVEALFSGGSDREQEVADHLMELEYDVIVVPTGNGLAGAIQAQHLGGVIGYGFAEELTYDHNLNPLQEIDSFRRALFGAIESYKPKD